MFILLQDTTKLSTSLDMVAVKLSYTNLMCLYTAAPQYLLSEPWLYERYTLLAKKEIICKVSDFYICLLLTGPKSIVTCSTGHYQKQNSGVTVIRKWCPVCAKWPAWVFLALRSCNALVRYEICMVYKYYNNNLMKVFYLYEL